MRFQLTFPFVGLSTEQQRNNEDLLSGLNAVAQFVFSDVGVPTIVPNGTAIYFRRDPVPGAAVYLFDGATWTAVV